MHIFGGSCPLTEFCQVQNSLCVQVLRSPILAALLHRTPVVGVSQSLRRGISNGITELSQTAPPIPIFGTAAITLGIGPHSSCIVMLFQFIRNESSIMATRNQRNLLSYLLTEVLLLSRGSMLKNYFKEFQTGPEPPPSVDRPK